MYKKLIFLPLLASSLFAVNSYKEIKFEGLSQISTTIATETANFKPNQPYSDKQINTTLKKFYNFDYFNDIVVTTNDDVLIFKFIEKPFIAKIEMTGYKTREDEVKAVYDMMNIKKGNMYSKEKIQKAKRRLLSILEQEGYIHSVVEVEVESINKNSVTVKFIVNKGDEIIIQDINYVGTKGLDDSDLEDAMVNKEEDCCFTWFFGRSDGAMKFDELQNDKYRIKEKYMENGFLDAKVKDPFSTIDFNTNQAQIDVTIDEGIQYKVGTTTIYLDEKIKNPEEIYPELKLKKDKVFKVSRLRKDIKYIKTQVANKGYAFVKVKYDLRKDPKTGTADIIYNVIPGDKVYINDVIISGNSRTLDRVIRRNVYLAPESLFSLTDLNDSKSSLNRTGFFESVQIEQKRISKNKMDLIVKVQEAPTGNILLGGGYGSYDGLMLNASINDKNVFGSGLNLGFSVDWSKVETKFNLSLKNPAIYDSKYSGSASLYKIDSEINYTGYDLNQTKSGLSLGVGRSLNRHTHIGLSYSLLQTTEIYDDVDEEELEESGYTLEELEEQNIEYITSSITPYIVFNNTDSYFNPRSGIIARTSLEIAGLGGDSKYLKSSSSVKYFKDLEDYVNFDAIFRYKVKVNLLQDEGFIARGNSFYLGGTGSVRGYKSYAFGPESVYDEPYKRLFANSFEVSFPLLPSAKMRWGLFYDYGMIGENTFNDINRSGAGALIEWQSPMGPMQFIFANALDAQPGDDTSSFEFSLGTTF